MENNFCGLEQFRQRLFIEKRRSERFNYRSSIILFNFAKYLKYFLKKKIFERLIKIICSNFRATDVVSFYKGNTILILLPDTEHNDAQHICEKLMNALITDSKFDFHLKTIISDDFEAEIFSYPEKVTENRLLKDGILHNETEKRKSKSINFIPSKTNKFSMNYIDILNLSTSIYSSSALAVPNVKSFFLDQELRLNFLKNLNKFVKRMNDIAFSIISLVICSSVLILIALLIELTSRGPILFKQERVGYRGNYFTFYKFRTMYSNNDTSSHQEFMKKHINGNNAEINNGEKDDPLYKIKNDPRITPIGKILRKSSLDELPQLWHVLKGEMSFVGPRLPIPYEVREYKNWHYRRVTEVKPGITGLWQVSGRNCTTFDEMVRLDIHYAQNWSFLLI